MLSFYSNYHEEDHFDLFIFTLILMALGSKFVVVYEILSRAWFI